MLSGFVYHHCAEPPSGTLKNNKKLEMNYMNYDKVIVLGLRVKLVGWPKAVSFAKPSSIGSVVNARMLHDALMSGECHWIKLTTRQVDDHRKELENCEAEGETIGKPRKKRSDAGKKQKDRSSDNIENEWPTEKKLGVLQSLPRLPRGPFVLPLTTTKTTRVKADPIYMDNMKVSFSHGQSFKCRHYCQSPIQFISSLLPSSPCYQPYTILLFGFTTILKTILMLHLKCIVW
jgi:hypothetical protein